MDSNAWIALLALLLGGVASHFRLGSSLGAKIALVEQKNKTTEQRVTYVETSLGAKLSDLKDEHKSYITKVDALAQKINDIGTSIAKIEGYLYAEKTHNKEN